MDECWRVLKPTGSAWINLGDKYAGSGGHNNASLSGSMNGATLQGGMRGMLAKREADKATRRNAPDRYNQDGGGVLPKSLMGLPWGFALGCINPELYRTTPSPQWILRRDLIWHKLNGLPESVTDRCRSSHEYWFHLVKQGRYYSAVDELREPHADVSLARTGQKRLTPDRSQEGVSGPNSLDPAEMCHTLGKLPGSVWSIPSEPLVIPEAVRAHYDLPDHFASFPTEWPRRLILGWSPPGICVACGKGRRPVVDVEYEQIGSSTSGQKRDAREPFGRLNGTGMFGGKPVSRKNVSVTGYACACDVPAAPTRPAVVLDPFAGTGTVPMVARALGRLGVGLDLSRSYCRLAQWRVWESGHAAKAEQRTWRDAQAGMFG
jgi:DNA modification methylase